MIRTTNQRLLDELTERDVEIDRYRRGLVLRMLDLLARVEEDVTAQIGRLSPSDVRPSYREARLVRLLAAVGERVNEYGAMLEEDFVGEFNEFARDEAAFGVRLLSEVPPVPFDVVKPSTALLRAAVESRPFEGVNLREWIKVHPASVRSRLRGAIRMGVVQGETTDKMVQRIRGTRAAGYKDGVMETNRRGAEYMVRTAVTHVTVVARETTYAENTDLVKGVRWTSTLDGRTSMVCLARDGKVYPVNSGPRPPAHGRCRSTTVPVLKSWKELGVSLPGAPSGTRASMDGQVPAEQNYGDWLRGRTTGFQDEVLGKTRSRLFREGDFPADKFVDYSGRVLTLEQLRKRQPEAFKRAGL